METLAAAVTGLGDPDQPLLYAGRVYDVREVRARAYKTGNALRHRGVREGTTVAVVDDGTVNPLFCLFGATLLGAAVAFDPPSEVDARVLAGPTDKLAEYDLPAGGQRVGWGDPPADPSWMHFERDVWSENPAFPEPSVMTATELLPGVSHSDAVSAAEPIAATFDGDDRVAIRAPLSNDGTVVAGVVAPLLAGASILLPASEQRGTVAVAAGNQPEERAVDPGDAAP